MNKHDKEFLKLMATQNKILWSLATILASSILLATLLYYYGVKYGV